MSGQVCWDDINLDDLLGEFTDDETYDNEGSTDDESVAPKRAKKQKKSSNQASEKEIYTCPSCPKTYRSISGFQSHVKKKHNIDIKASDHMINGPAKTDKNKDTSDSIIPLNKETFEEVYQSAFSGTLDYIRGTQFRNFQSSKHGEIIVATANTCHERYREFSNTLKPLQSELFNIITTSSGGSLSTKREKMLQKFQQYKARMNLHTVLADTIGVPPLQARVFMHLFIFELFTRVIEEAVLVLKVGHEEFLEKEQLTQTDQEVLYYISGFIIKSLKSRWRGSSSDFIPIETKMSAPWPSNPFTQWLTRINRGGLKQPSQNMYYLIRNLELESQKHFSKEDLSSFSMDRPVMKEKMMDSFMTQYYWNQLGGTQTQALLEAAVDIFMKVRGSAVAKFVKRRSDQQGVKRGKNKSSLRGTLIDISNK